MLQSFYEWTHATTSLHFWDWFAFAVAIIVAVVFIIHHRNQNKRDEEIRTNVEETMTNLNTVMTKGGVAGCTEAITNAAKNADLPGPKLDEEKAS